MQKEIMKTVRRISHLHLHLGIHIAIAAIIITALHTSSEMVYALYGVQPSYADAGGSNLREARQYETHVGSAQINIARRAYVGGA